MKPRPYKELDVWKASMDLSGWAYFITRSFPVEETHGLASRIRICSESVPSDIAEGFGRHNVDDAIILFSTARSSLYRLETLSHVCFEQKFITGKVFAETIQRITRCKKLLNSFIKYYKTIEINGNTTEAPSMRY